ncbi:uncharacterized protein MKZ38_006781 [Zalerion maritima]|uniref:Clathrin light chain n=1 Tax=Zalerion maritima TaxID=339359 RepID=A0AAD5RIT5_9PEZI|nr:uncharacterized protein MKZ38_006781 [Zalerion maritima]
MADRFPSLEDFDEGGQTDVKDASADPSTDDFLAREKALLGDDADQFATNQDVIALGDASGEPNETAAFEQQFPDITSTPQPAQPSVSYNSGFQSYVEEEEDPEPIKEWRARRDESNAKRQAKFEAQRKEAIEEAQENIDEFYNNYNAKKEKSIAQTRREADEFLNNRDDTVSGGTSWERIAKLVDLTGKGAKGGADGTQKERYRKLLISLRKDEKAPGAEGY